MKPVKISKCDRDRLVEIRTSPRDTAVELDGLYCFWGARDALLVTVPALRWLAAQAPSLLAQVEAMRRARDLYRARLAAANTDEDRAAIVLEEAQRIYEAA